MEIKSFRDGNRLILVLEECSLESEKNLFELLKSLTDTPIESADIPEIVPTNAPLPSDPPMNLSVQSELGASAPEIDDNMLLDAALKLSVNGKTENLGEAISQNDTRAIVDLCLRTQSIDPQIRPFALKTCKSYILNDCERRVPEVASVREIRNFFALYAPLISLSVNEILQSAGCNTLKDFFESYEDYVLQDAYRAILDNLVERISE